MAEERRKKDGGCCKGITRETPKVLANPPGRAEISYRVGTHGSFKASMLAGLAGPGGLPSLSTRSDDDPAIALLDAAAGMLDVLTFYQERIANEGYLRTATERQSVLELARAIGYQLKPGVAAGTYLAFEMESAPGAPASALILVGTKVQSLPGQDEKPQTFETVEQIEARPEWNRLRPQSFATAAPRFGDRSLYLQGVSTNLQPGDALLIIGDERRKDPGNENWDIRQVIRVTPVAATEPAAGYTVVELDQGLGTHLPHTEPARLNPKVYALRLRASLFGYNAPDWRCMPRSIKANYLGLAEGELDERQNSDLLLAPEWPDLTIAAISDPPGDRAAGSGLYGEYFDRPDLSRRKLSRTDASIDFTWLSDSPAAGIIGPDNFSVRWSGWVHATVTGSHTFYTQSDDGVRLWVDGKLIINNWTDHASTENSGSIELKAGKKYDLKLEFYEKSGHAVMQLLWSAPGLTKEIIPTAHLYPGDMHNVHLDAVYPRLVKGGWVVLSVPHYQEVYSIARLAEDSRTGFSLSAKTSCLTLKGENLRKEFNESIRETQVLAQSEELPMAARPILDPVQGNSVRLDRLLPGLEEGRTLIFTGRRMRVAVLSPIQLVADDGASTASWPAGASLLLEQTPATLPSGRQTWTLTDKNGCTGTLTLASASQAEKTFQLVPSEKSDALVSEAAAIREVTPGSDPTELLLAWPLLRSYDRPTVTISANVAPATHGETRRELLGSGDAARGFQKFTLKQKPLSYLSAPTASGAASTLQVRVNDVLWQETASLYQLPARGHNYTTRLDDEGNVTVTFGNGVNGSRLPSGEENVSATYRTGIGAAGMVKAGQLSLLITRPLGVQKVHNPLAASGAADPESRDQARLSAPLTVLTLERIVSLRDFEDFARSFAGIGKAQASWLWDGEQRIVHLTIAAAAGNGSDFTVDPQSALFKNLRQAMDAVRDTVQPLLIASYQPMFFRLKARVLIDGRYLPEKVLAAVTDTLRLAYSLERRDFGQPLAKSEVLAVIQGVPGVSGVFLDQLHLRGTTSGLPTLLPAHRARRKQIPGARETVVELGQLLLLDPGGIEVTEEITK